jgi:hypothetical protein
MATVEDIRNRKRIRAEFTKRPLDITGMDLQVLHGVVYLRGVIKGLKGGAGVRTELEHVVTAIRQLNLARDVIVQATIRES